MSTGQWDDPEYPYLPRYGGSAVPQAAQQTVTPLPWKSVVRWLIRGALATAALVALAFLVTGIVLSRAGWRAWSLADLDKPGTNISYWHEYPTNEDTLPQSWREALGDYWWSEVREISYTGDGSWGSIWTYLPPTADDVKRFCRTCGSFRRLQKFEIVTDHFTCDQIQHWPHLAKLEELDVESSQLTDADLAIIGKMTGLKNLRLAKAKITTAGLDHLAKLPNLESLTLYQVEVKVLAGKRATGFAALSSFSVSDSPSFDDEALIAMGSLPALEENVNFHRTAIGDRGLAHVLQSGKVRSLVIGDENRLTDQCFAELAKHEGPQWLVLAGKSLTDSGLVALEGAEIPTLVLSSTAVTDRAFESLAKIKGLDYLSLANTAVTGSGIKSWPADQRLGMLDLSGNPLTREAVQLLAKANIGELNLSYTSLDDEQLMLFAERDDLARLHVSETSVTEEGVKAFYEARKKRLKASGLEESLTLICDFPEVAERYYNLWGAAAGAITDDEIPFLTP